MPPTPLPPPSRPPCLFSFAAARDRCLRLRFLSAGLRPFSIPLPDGATVHLWAPPSTEPQPPPPKNPLLLLHGFGASATWQWAPYLRQLRRAGFSLYIPDLLFFGNSFAPGTDRSDTFQARTIKSALETIGVDRFGLVGVSYGGFVGYRMAALFPEAVEKAVLVAAGVCLEEADLQKGLFPVKDVHEAAELLVPRRPDQLKRLVRLTFVRPPCVMPSCFLQDYIQVKMSEYTEEKSELLYALISNRKLSDIPKISQPTLLIWGEQDQVFPLELANRLKRYLEDNPQLVIIKNAGHAVNLEKPKEVCKHIIEFFRQPFTKPSNGHKEQEVPSIKRSASI